MSGTDAASTQLRGLEGRVYTRKGKWPCCFCDGDMRVIDSRPMQDGIRRRRMCDGCGERVTTFEKERLDERDTWRWPS